MSNQQLTPTVILKLRTLILDDQIALQKWGHVKDDLITEPSVLIRINRNLKDMDCDFSSVIRDTLENWVCVTGIAATVDKFISILRYHNLNALSGNIINEFSKEASSDSQLDFVDELEETPPKRPKVQEHKRVLPQTWWPEHKEMIKAFVPRSNVDGQILVKYLRLQIVNSDLNATAIIAKKQAIVGMGGIGKTSTAKWYANEYQDQYDHILWIDSEDTAINNSFLRLGRQLGMDPDQSSLQFPDLVRDVYAKFAHFQCLFVFDNAERFDGTNGLSKILPRNELHHSIITSRNHDWGNPQEFGQIATFQLDVFTEAECKHLLSDRLDNLGKGGTEDEVLALGAELGYLPLALQCAVATIIKSKMYTLPTYLERIREDLKVLVDKANVLSEYERSISATLNLSIEQIEKDKEIEEECRTWCKMILNVASYCEPNAIPKELFTGLRSAKGHTINDALDILLVYSLISTDAETIPAQAFGIHRLLQHVIRHNGLAQPEFAIHAIKSMLDHIRVNHEELRRHGVRAWTLASTNYDQVLISHHNFPLHFPLEDPEFFRASLTRLRQVFTESALPALQIKFRLLVSLIRQGNAIALKEAKELHDTLHGQLTEVESNAIPFRCELQLHLRIIFISLRNSLAEGSSESEKDELSFLEAQRDLESTGYNGVVDGTKLYCPIWIELPELSLSIALRITYAVKLSEVGKEQQAAQVISIILYELRTLKMGMSSVQSVWMRLMNIPELSDATVSCLYEKVKTATAEEMSSDKMPFITILVDSYCVWLQNTSAYTEHHVDLLSFMNDVDWLGNEDHFMENLDVFQSTLDWVASAKNPTDSYDDILSVLNRSWGKLTDFISTRTTQVNVNVYHYHLLLQVSASYSITLMQCDSIRIEELKYLIKTTMMLFSAAGSSDGNVSDWAKFCSLEIPSCLFKSIRKILTRRVAVHDACVRDLLTQASGCNLELISLVISKHKSHAQTGMNEVDQQRFAMLLLILISHQEFTQVIKLVAELKTLKPGIALCDTTLNVEVTTAEDVSFEDQAKLIQSKLEEFVNLDESGDDDSDDQGTNSDVVRTNDTENVQPDSVLI